MIYFEKLEDLNNYYIFLYSQRAEGVDFLSKRFYRKIDKTILRDYKRSLKLFKKQDKINFKVEKREICSRTRFYLFFSKLFKRKTKNKEEDFKK